MCRKLEDNKKFQSFPNFEAKCWPYWPWSFVSCNYGFHSQCTGKKKIIPEGAIVLIIGDYEKGSTYNRVCLFVSLHFSSVSLGGKKTCVFQVSRPYLGFCPDPKHFIVKTEQIN